MIEITKYSKNEKMCKTCSIYVRPKNKNIINNLTTIKRNIRLMGSDVYDVFLQLEKPFIGCIVFCMIDDNDEIRNYLNNI